MIRVTVGENVRYYRKLKGWSQEDLAYNSGVCLKQIGAIERGRTNPTIETLCYIASGLGVDVEQLVHEPPTVDLLPSPLTRMQPLFDRLSPKAQALIEQSLHGMIAAFLKEALLETGQE